MVSGDVTEFCKYGVAIISTIESWDHCYLGKWTDWPELLFVILPLTTEISDSFYCSFIIISYFHDNLKIKCYIQSFDKENRHGLVHHGLSSYLIKIPIKSSSTFWKIEYFVNPYLRQDGLLITPYRKPKKWPPTIPKFCDISYFDITYPHLFKPSKKMFLIVIFGV